MSHKNLAVTILCLLPGTILAQDAPGTRAEEIERARQQKAEALEPEEVSPVERRLRDFKDQKLLERVSAGYNGFRLKLGGLVTGGGFALGPEYFREDLLDGRMFVRASAQGSTRLYTKVEGETGFNFLDGRATLSFLGYHRDYPGLNYYGPGPDSVLTGRSNYRLEDTGVSAFATIQATRHLTFGGTAGGLWINVGPGTDDRYVSTDVIYSPLQAPGINQQSNYFRPGVFAQFDYRDDPFGPKAGGNYVFQHTWYNDIDLGVFGFRRMDIDLQQYIPFFNKTRRFALRAKGTFTESDAGNVTPFFLQPVVGGSDDLRGFRYFRFTDRNMVVYNAEYQWEVFSGLEGAVFFDAGKVMPRRSQLNFSDLETSAGFGLRFNARNRTFIRVDVGFSHEGFQVWFKFNDVFNARRFGTSAGQPVY